MNGFVKISRYAGLREDLAQASGGNSSFKLDDSKMYVKASGYHLYEVTDDSAFSVVNYLKICDFLDKTIDEEINDSDGKKVLEDAVISGGRPSIETFFHSLSYKYVLHTHPTVVNILACRKDGMGVLSELFPNALMIPYATPGVDLAKEYYNVYKAHVDTYDGVAFLQNHGLVVSANKAEEVIDLTEKVLIKIEKYLGIDYSDYHNQTILNGYFPDKIVWKVNDYEVLQNASDNVLDKGLSFCPDCVVFLGKSVLRLDDNFTHNDIAGYCKMYGEPVIVKWGKMIYIVADSVKKAIDIQSVLSFAVKVIKNNLDKDCNMLSDEEQNFLLGWEAEKYRQKI